MTANDLSPAEARVLGVLVEKQRSVPDAYPLTLNALVSGCNQKTSRDPVMSLTDAEVQEALDALKHRSLVIETSGGRVMRYAHNVERALAIPAQSAAILAALLLRGPQTVGELRINTDRMHRFADISAVEGFLHELAARPQGALVAELPRAAGTREVRWMQLLSGPAPRTAAVTVPLANEADEASVAASVATLQQEVAALRDELAALRSEVQAWRRER
jgi:uncharacterized protein YceH (UPF0502 family)